MNTLEKKIYTVLKDVNEDILSYKGTNMLDDGIVNSFSFISMIGMIEDSFNIEIDEDLLDEDHFGNIDRIISTINTILEG